MTYCFFMFLLYASVFFCVFFTYSETHCVVLLLVPLVFELNLVPAPWDQVQDQVWSLWIQTHVHNSSLCLFSVFLMSNFPETCLFRPPFTLFLLLSYDLSLILFSSRLYMSLVAVFLWAKAWPTSFLRHDSDGLGLLKDILTTIFAFTSLQYTVLLYNHDAKHVQ